MRLRMVQPILRATTIKQALEDGATEGIERQKPHGASRQLMSKPRIHLGRHGSRRSHIFGVPERLRTMSGILYGGQRVSPCTPAPNCNQMRNRASAQMCAAFATQASRSRRIPYRVGRKRQRAIHVAGLPAQHNEHVDTLGPQGAIETRLSSMRRPGINEGAHPRLVLGQIET